jgi:hypothetical protein
MLLITIDEEFEFCLISAELHSQLQDNAVNIYFQLFDSAATHTARQEVQKR